jgi:hypothetical protein
MDHDQLFKAVLTAHLAPFLELFFADEAAQLDLERARFVDKELFAAPPMGPGREVDILVDVPLRPGAARAGEPDGEALIAIQIEVQSQRDLEFLWRNAEYYVLLRRLRGLDVLPIALFPIVDVLGARSGRRPRVGHERVRQRDDVLGLRVFEFAYFAVTLGGLDAAEYLDRHQALAGALAARMRPRAPLEEHKLACLRRIMEGGGVARDVDRTLLVDVVETYLPLTGADAERFEDLLRRPENEGIRAHMKTWSEAQQEIGEARGEARGRLAAVQDALLALLEARLGPVPLEVVARVRAIGDEATLRGLLLRAADAKTLADLGLT